MTRKLAINPVTRTNGVYSLEAEVDGGVVVDARSIGPVFRGFEVLLQGRHPLDAPYFTERVCGICSSAHGTAASLALEAAAEAVPPPNGLWVRNLIQGGDFLQNHIRHFYLLALPDYWAGPDVAPLRPHAGQDLRFGRAAEERLTRGYTGALAASRRAHQFAAMIGGKAPFPHGLMPGGATVSPHAQLLVELAAVLKDIRAFIDDHMLPDLELLLATYPEYRTVGTGPADFISYDLFRQPGAAPVFAAGTVVDGRPEPLNQHEIAEDIQHAYFAGTGSHHPAGGQTHPDPAKPGAYSWVKAPRYRGRPMECGPVARAYRPGGAGPSVLGRIEARVREAATIAGLMEGWLQQIVPGDPVYEPVRLPRDFTALGLTGAQRGALGHWVHVEGGRIAAYQIVTPSAWNFSPRDHLGQPGPVERALIGVRVANEEAPVEILRTVRSFDPCVACAVHLVRAGRTGRTLLL